LIIDRVGRSTVKVVRRMTEAKAEVEAEKVGGEGRGDSVRLVVRW